MTDSVSIFPENIPWADDDWEDGLSKSQARRFRLIAYALHTIDIFFWGDHYGTSQRGEFNSLLEIYNKVRSHPVREIRERVSCGIKTIKLAHFLYLLGGYEIIRQWVIEGKI